MLNAWPINTSVKATVATAISFSVIPTSLNLSFLLFYLTHSFVCVYLFSFFTLCITVFCDTTFAKGSP